MYEYKLLINGRQVNGAKTMGIVNPATEEVFAQCPCANEDQLDEAVAAAKAAFPEWSRKSLKERSELLLRLADALTERASEVAHVLTEEQGKPLSEATWETHGAAEFIKYVTSLDLSPKVLKESAKERIIQHREPLGVVGTITPWNVPLMLLMIKVAPALLAGNTVVSKPAPTTPLSTLLFGEICADILPPGVMNVIADQNDLGERLTSHPDVDKIAFTGSTATGKKVMGSAAGTLKRLTLELGGNDAAIVLEDCDPRDVSSKLLAGATMNCGQICLAIKRVYVHESIYDAVCDELAKMAGNIIVGNGLEDNTQMGPIQNRTQYEKVKEYIEVARNNGNIIAGGYLPEGKGYFIPPTIVRDIPENSSLVHEEQFGPVLPILKYDDIEDAVTRANDSPWGLGGTIWTADVERGYEIARKIDSGTVWVNKHLDLQPDIPFSGTKQSGIGTEYGQEGLEEFTKRKIINIAI